ncbi:hypothetical protein C2S51_010693 [Perilla frutescens var. frutescens]|nr:hypothetical protein C2S51_010693 [Perilla frutescens var. frutescens]
MRDIGGEVFKKFGKVDFEIWAVTLSSIWFFLCKEKHEPHGPKVDVGIDFSQSLPEAFHAARGSLLLQMSIGVKIGSEEWIPPTEGVFRLDVDAAFQEERGRFGVGCVVRDWKGRIRATLVNPIQRTTSVLDAELNAVLYGVGLCLQKNLVPFVVYSDSILAIRLLENGEEGKEYIERELSPLAEVIQNGFIIGFRHMLREANSVAHT